MQEFQEEFEMYEDMFQHLGWKKLIENAENQHKNIMGSAVQCAPTNDQWQYLRGQITQLEQLIGFESYVTQTLKHLNEEANPDSMLSDLNTLEL